MDYTNYSKSVNALFMFPDSALMDLKVYWGNTSGSNNHTY